MDSPQGFPKFIISIKTLQILILRWLAALAATHALRALELVTVAQPTGFRLAARVTELVLHQAPSLFLASRPLPNLELQSLQPPLSLNSRSRPVPLFLPRSQSIKSPHCEFLGELFVLLLITAPQLAMAWWTTSNSALASMETMMAS